LTIFDTAWKLVVIFVVGSLLLDFHYMIHGVPLGNVPFTEKTAFIVGVLVVIFSQPFYILLSRFGSFKYREVVSLITGSVLIFLALLIFPVGIPYAKVIPIDDKTEQLILKDSDFFEKLIKKADKKGKEVTFIEREGYYNLYANGDNFSIPIISKQLVKPITYAVYVLDLPDKKLLLVKEVYRQNRDFVFFLLFVGVIYFVATLMEVFIKPKEERR